MLNDRAVVGRDDDDGIGWLIGIIIVIAIVMGIIMLISTIGAFIGAFWSIRNYAASFKENVVDSNRLPQAA